jgi:hypothetical protein
MEMDETMSCGKVYVCMDEYLAWRAARSAVSVSECTNAAGSTTGLPAQSRNGIRQEAAISD